MGLWLLFLTTSNPVEVLPFDLTDAAQLRVAHTTLLRMAAALLLDYRRHDASAAGLTRDLLSVEFFEQGLDAARSVGRVVTRGRAHSTGFLVSPELMMTNRHVLDDPAEAAASTLELDYEANRFGAPKSTQIFRLRPDRFFLSDRDLDSIVDYLSTLR